MRFPVTMFAVGRISIDKDAVTFASTTPFSRYRNIAANFNFAFHANDITQITRYDSPSPVAKYFNLPFARFRTRASGVLADLLLCVGGQGPRMGLIRRRNADLFAELAKSFPQVSDGLTKPSA